MKTKLSDVVFARSIAAKEESREEYMLTIIVDFGLCCCLLKISFGEFKNSHAESFFKASNRL